MCRHLKTYPGHVAQEGEDPQPADAEAGWEDEEDDVDDEEDEEMGEEALDTTPSPNTPRQSTAPVGRQVPLVAQQPQWFSYPAPVFPLDPIQTQRLLETLQNHPPSVPFTPYQPFNIYGPTSFHGPNNFHGQPNFESYRVSPRTANFIANRAQAAANMVTQTLLANPSVTAAAAASFQGNLQGQTNGPMTPQQQGASGFVQRQTPQMQMNPQTQRQFDYNWVQSPANVVNQSRTNAVDQSPRKYITQSPLADPFGGPMATLQGSSRQNQYQGVNQQNQTNPQSHVSPQQRRAPGHSFAHSQQQQQPNQASGYNLMQSQLIQDDLSADSQMQEALANSLVPLPSTISTFGRTPVDSQPAMQQQQRANPQVQPHGASGQYGLSPTNPVARAVSRGSVALDYRVGLIQQSRFRGRQVVELVEHEADLDEVDEEEVRSTWRALQ